MSRYIILVFCLISFQRDVHMSSCDLNCTDAPVFTPSRLVVKHGDSASATCSVCQSKCIDTLFDLEKSFGVTSKDGTTIKWRVDRMEEWGSSPMCFYNDDDNQCCTYLPITLYKPPDSVSITFLNPTGSMVEGRQYTLQCAVRNVAPVENLSVTFYRGNSPLRSSKSVNLAKKPESETFYHIITASKEDDGAQYWCEAKLELGPEGPNPPPVVKSQNLNTTVHYKPRLNVSKKSITITEGNHLRLSCSAVGNPTPLITWTRDNSTLTNNGVLFIDSVATRDEGEYVCYASNRIATVMVSVKVEVQVNYIPYIILGVVVPAVILLALLLLGYVKYYRTYRMGQYNLTDDFRLRQQHIPVPVA